MTLEGMIHAAPLITAFVAVVGLLTVSVQIWVARMASNQASATGYYTALLSKALEYPQFLAPDPKSVNPDKETFDGNRNEFRRYESFVDLMLTTFQQMNTLGGVDAPTRNYMVQWVSAHLKYLESVYFKRYFQNQLSPDLGKLIEAAKLYEARLANAKQRKAAA